jgi:hypothetical protein
MTEIPRFPDTKDATGAVVQGKPLLVEGSALEFDERQPICWLRLKELRPVGLLLSNSQHRWTIGAIARAEWESEAERLRAIPIFRDGEDGYTKEWLAELPIGSRISEARDTAEVWRAFGGGRTMACAGISSADGL